MRCLNQVLHRARAVLARYRLVARVARAVTRRAQTVVEHLRRRRRRLGATSRRRRRQLAAAVVMSVRSRRVGGRQATIAAGRHRATADAAATDRRHRAAGIRLLILLLHLSKDSARAPKSLHVIGRFIQVGAICWKRLHRLSVGGRRTTTINFRLPLNRCARGAGALTAQLVRRRRRVLIARIERVRPLPLNIR